MINELQIKIETALLDYHKVVVYFSSKLGGDYGRYCDNGTIFVSSSLQGNEEETLKVTAHEAVHHLQLTKRILIGENPPHYWNPKLTPSQSLLLEEIVKDQYDPEDWKWELPAWSLQYDPRRVLELLQQ